MSKRIIWIFILSFFISAYFGMQVYNFYKLHYFFGWALSITNLLILLVLAISFIVTNILESKYGGLVFTVIYAFSAGFFGASFIFFIVSVISEAVNLFITTPRLETGIVVLVLSAILTVKAIINASTHTIKERIIPLKKLKKSLSIVHLSDIHIGLLRRKRFLQRVVEKTNKLKADIVVITGDIVEGTGEFDKTMFHPLNDIKAPVFFSIGNHEEYFGLKRIIAYLHSIRMKILRDESVIIKGIQLIGVDNIEPGREKTLGDVLKKIKLEKSVPKVLLYHQPIEVETAEKKGIDLQLSGHTHNGQIAPFNLVVKVIYPYIKGLYKYKGLYIHVCPGTGTWGPPMRLGSRNEISLLKLVPG